MSTVTEDELHAETDPDADPDSEPDDEGGEETDNEAAEEAEQAEQEASTQATLKALEKENARHAAAFAKALGLTADDLHDCPTCGATGFTPEPMEAAPQLERDPNTDTCPVCQGYGDVLTGAKPPRERTRACTQCGGSGYVTRTVEPGTPVVAPPMPPTPTVPQPTGYTAPGDAASVADLRARGYVIVEPVPPPAPSAT